MEKGIKKRQGKKNVIFLLFACGEKKNKRKWDGCSLLPKPTDFSHSKKELFFSHSKKENKVKTTD